MEIKNPTPTSIMGVDDWLTDPKNLDIATLSGDTKRKIRTYVLRTAESAKRDEREIWIEHLKRIANLDKTPRYDYGTGKNSTNGIGEVSGSGTRFKTPKEYIKDLNL